MKRTKQRADRAGQAKPEHVSGCRQFEGEDLSKYPLKHFFVVEHFINDGFWLQCTTIGWSSTHRIRRTGPTSSAVKTWPLPRPRERKRPHGPLKRRPFSGCVACSRTNSINAPLRCTRRWLRKTREWPVTRNSGSRTGATTKRTRTKLRWLSLITTKFWRALAPSAGWTTTDEVGERKIEGEWVGY